MQDWQNRLIVSDRAHLVFDFHQAVDGLQEAEKGGKSLGTTKKGIGPAYSSKATRNGIRVGDLIGEFTVFSDKWESSNTAWCAHEQLLPVLDSKQLSWHIKDYSPVAMSTLTLNLCVTKNMLKDYVRSSKTLCSIFIQRCAMARLFLLKELMLLCSILTSELIRMWRVATARSEASLLDLESHRKPSAKLSVLSRLTVSCQRNVRSDQSASFLSIIPATRVGDGPFPSEQLNVRNLIRFPWIFLTFSLLKDIGKLLQERGAEIGVTTRRVRRCGWLDLPVLRYTSLVNGYSAICLTKLDILDSLNEIKIAIK